MREPLDKERVLSARGRPASYALAKNRLYTQNPRVHDSLGVMGVSVTYVIDKTRRLIRTSCIGPVTLADIVEHFRKLKDDPDCAGHLDVLLDVHEADLLPDSNQLRLVDSHVAAARENVEFGICAIVADRDAMFGMMRMFGVFTQRNFRAIRVFRELLEAEAWLTSQGTDDVASLH